MVVHASNPGAAEIERAGSMGLDGKLVLSNQLVPALIKGPASKSKVGSKEKAHVDLWPPQACALANTSTYVHLQTHVCTYTFIYTLTHQHATCTYMTFTMLQISNILKSIFLI